MAKYQVLYWKDIPSIVEASDGSTSAKVQLSERFQMLIDSVAMRLGLAGTDAYLDQWEHGDEQERPGSPGDVAKVVAQELEARFPEFRDRGLGSP